MDDGKLVITPITQQKYSLEQLLSKITPDNLYREVDSDETIGNEAW